MPRLLHGRTVHYAPWHGVLMGGARPFTRRWRVLGRPAGRGGPLPMWGLAGVLPAPAFDLEAHPLHLIAGRPRRRRACACVAAAAARRGRRPNLLLKLRVGLTND